MDNLVQILGKYVISAILIILGLVFIIKYMGGDALESQPTTMLISGILLIGVGIVAIPDILKAIPQKMYTVLFLVGVLLSAYLAYQVWYSVDEEIEFQAKRESINKAVIQRLTDIRDAELAYREIHGKFTNNFDTLIEFIKAPEIPVPFKMGSFHDTLPELEAQEEGLVIKRDDIDSIATMKGLSSDEFYDMIVNNETVYKVRDTVYTSFFAENFAPEVRKTHKLPPVALDSLPFTPSSGKRFLIAIGTAKTGGVTQSTIEVKDPTPFGRPKVKKDTLKFGSLTEPHTDGNWRR